MPSHVILAVRKTRCVILINRFTVGKLKLNLEFSFNKATDKGLHWSRVTVLGDGLASPCTFRGEGGGRDGSGCTGGTTCLRARMAAGGGVAGLVTGRRATGEVWRWWCFFALPPLVLGSSVPICLLIKDHPTISINKKYACFGVYCWLMNHNSMWFTVVP